MSIKKRKIPFSVTFFVGVLFLFALQLNTAFAAIYPGGNNAWLVVGSRDNPSAAINYARKLTGQHKSVHVFLSNNGWYAITLGWLNKSSGNNVKSRLVGSRLIPGDSYFHSGERFVELIWSTSGVTGRSTRPILNATAYHTRSQPIQKTCFINDTTDTTLNVRATPNGKIINRLRNGRQVTITQIKNDNKGRPWGLAANWGWVYMPKVSCDGSYVPPVQIDLSDNGPGYVTGLKNQGDNYLSLRIGPSTKQREIARMRINTPLTILGKRNGWYNIQMDNGKKGWSSGKYIALGQYIEPEPELIIDNSENGKLLEVTDINDTDDFLSLRSGPGTGHGVLARLRNKTKAIVTGRRGQWYRIKPNNTSLEGWSSAKFLTEAEVPLIGPPEKELSDNEENTPPIIEPETEEKTELAEKPDSNIEIPIADGKRVALVLGNSAYVHTTELANPKNDADKISSTLERLGFKVIVGLDGKKSDMENSVREFVRILPDANVALFFYAGHAMQVNGENFLIPIDAKLEDSTAIDFETINVKSILNFIDQPGRISIALLDACRDNPLSRRFARKLGSTRSAFIGRGLASPTTTGNLLIGFATAPGEVALDGEGENSPFTTALLNHMTTPDLEVEAMLKRVRSEVFELTKEQQSPWVNSGLRKEFYFAKSNTEE